MQVFKIKLKIKSGVITSFYADALFGHLCWVYVHREGEKALQDFLQPFKEGNPPFVISDGFPTDYLPKPLTVDFLAPADKYKDVRKIDYVLLKDFNNIRQGKFSVSETKEKPFKLTLSTHSSINRLTNTTSEGDLYNLSEMIISEFSIYLKVISDEWKDKVVDLLEELSKIGYGKKKSIGKGQFSVGEIEKFNFTTIEDANGFVTLSNFCPAENDPTEGLYKTFVKYGKLGEDFTFCGNPFKRPLLMIKTGSVFKTQGKPKEYYGRMIEKIAPAKESEVVQYAYSFAVPIKYLEF